MPLFSAVALALCLAGATAQAGSSSSSSTVTLEWDAPPAASTLAIPTYLDQVNPSMDRVSPMHDAAFRRMDKLGAKLGSDRIWGQTFN